MHQKTAIPEATITQLLNGYKQVLKLSIAPTHTNSNALNNNITIPNHINIQIIVDNK